MNPKSTLDFFYTVSVAVHVISYHLNIKRKIEVLIKKNIIDIFSHCFYRYFYDSVDCLQAYNGTFGSGRHGSCSASGNDFILLYPTIRNVKTHFTIVKNEVMFLVAI